MKGARGATKGCTNGSSNTLMTNSTPADGRKQVIVNQTINMEKQTKQATSTHRFKNQL